MKECEPDPGRYVDELLLQIEAHDKADIYMFAGPVSARSERVLNHCLVDCKQNENIIFFVTTQGGSADVAYQIVRSIRRNYQSGKFTLFVDSICKSAGTLIALGADEIIMSDTAELGPLDVQIQKQGELGEYLSGLTPTQALSTLRDAAFDAFEAQFLQLRFKSGGAISTKLAAELAVKLVSGLFRPVYAQFDPMRLGENSRANKVAQAYGERIQTANVKADTLNGLINHYPSHGFVIDRHEAADLFNNVKPPTDSQSQLGKVLWQVCLDALDGDEPVIRPLKGTKGDDNGSKAEELSSKENQTNQTAAAPSNSNGEVAGSSPKENAGYGASE